MAISASAFGDGPNDRLPFLLMSDTDSCDIRTAEGTPAWYELMSFHRTWLGRLIPRWLLTPVWDPKIFRVLQSRPAYLLSSIEAWQSTVWQAGALTKATREAIAVAVSTANQCVY